MSRTRRDKTRRDGTRDRALLNQGSGAAAPSKPLVEGPKSKSSLGLYTPSFVPLLLGLVQSAHQAQNSSQVQHRASYNLALRPLGPIVEMTDQDWSLAGSYFQFTPAHWLFIQANRNLHTF